MLGKERCFGRFPSFVDIMRRRPHAVAHVKGSDDYSEILGIVRFYQTDCGVLVAAEVTGLPYMLGKCEHFVFGFHIHEGESCTGNKEDMFADVKMHYNPYDCEHPRHAGDLPPLFGNDEYAFAVFLTDRFGVNEVLGKTIIIHGSPDNFVTQPSGNSGEKIACGKIVAN